MSAVPGYARLLSEGERTPDSFWISLRYFNLYRIIVALLFFGSTLIYNDALSLGSQSLELFRSVSAVYVLLGLVFQGVLINVRERFNLQLGLQVCVDIVAITLLMYSSGGVRSGLGVMLLITLTGAALVAPRRLTFLYAALATIALLLEQSYWVVVRDAPSADFLQGALLAIGCFASAGITGLLAQRVAANETLARMRGRALEIQMRVNQFVIEDMHDGVIVLDQDGRVVQHNPQAQRLMGIEPLLGAELARVLPGFAPRWAVWRGGQGDGREGGADFEVNGRDVRLRLLETGANEDYRVLFIEDMTRTREQAQQLKLAALGRLTANIAHEIRNPLSAISHATELLEEERRERDRGRLYRIIRDNSQRLERLVADVLQLSRRDRVTGERIHLNSWLTGFLEEFVANESLSPERIVIQSMRDAWVRFDREHLRQVLWNLLRNAVRHSREEAGSIRIVLRGFGDQVELSVIDNGPGVAPDNRGQLFEPFFTTDSKGTGLGLYLARELCAANRAALEYVGDMPGAHFRIVCKEARAA
ncbi:MAG: two-component system sensor histidine kinase NtrB [Sphingomonadaceae bacterium]